MGGPHRGPAGAGRDHHAAERSVRPGRPGRAGRCVMTAAERTTDKDTGDRWYEYAPTGELLDSVTSVISGTNAKPWLTGWAGGVSVGWAADNMTLLAQTLKDKGRQAAIDLGKGEAERIRQVKADAGTYVHDV